MNDNGIYYTYITYDPEPWQVQIFLNDEENTVWAFYPELPPNSEVIDISFLNRKIENLDANKEAEIAAAIAAINAKYAAELDTLTEQRKLAVEKFGEDILAEYYQGV